MKRERVQSSLRDWKGMDCPKMALTSSSFFAFPVTKVTGLGTNNPLAAAISPPFLLPFSMAQENGNGKSLVAERWKKNRVHSADCKTVEHVT